MSVDYELVKAMLTKLILPPKSLDTDLRCLMVW